MPPDAALAEIAWDASAAAAHKERRKAETARAARKRRVNAARPRPHPGPAAAALLDAGKAGRVSPRVFAGLVRFGELALLSGLGFLIAHVYVAELIRQYAAALALTGLASITVFQALGLYTIPAFSTAHRQIPRLLMGWTATVGLLLAAVFFLKLAPEFSRVWLALWYVGGAVALLGYRAGVAALTRQGLANGHLTRRAIVYGTGPACESLLEALDADPYSDVRVCGVFDDRGVDRASRSIAGYPNLGNLEALMHYCRRTRIDMLVVALPLCAEMRVLELVKKLWVLPVDIRLAAHASKLRFRPRVHSFAGVVPLIDLIDKPITDWDVIVKWLFDKSVAALALLGLAPAMTLIALAIKLDSRGPVLFRQKRHGFNNELIEVYKFRSMYVDKTDAHAAKLVTKDDPRVTRVGRFIRKTSLDELPQLFNVLKGELSLVGPRPHALQAKAADRLYHDVVDGYFARHKVKPGITGWAQINGWRGETDTPEKIQKRVEHDLYYIDNWSVFLDLYILLKTPFALLRGENAY
jgi:Undecaprenyl-phosphate glucose phosphotransferase